MRGRPRLADRTRTDEDGNEWRVCFICEKEKPIAEYTKEGTSAGICIPCRRERQRRYYAEGRITPISREHRKKLARESRARNIDKRHQEGKEYRERIKADPKLHAKFLETRRISGRLRAEREGRSLDSIKKPTPRKTPVLKHKRLPSQPLFHLIDERIKQIRKYEKSMGITQERHAKPAGEICEELGTSFRTFTYWRKGEQPEIQVGTAERILLNANVDWRDVYPEYALVFEGP
jgi:hypothetical protein